jgi:L-ribulokinase
MSIQAHDSYVLGLDYGSDSCRAVLIDAATGKESGVSVQYFPRWSKGLYCDPGANQFRQHPQDYIDVLVASVREAAAKAGKKTASKIRGIAIDTTGSTPCAVDAAGTPLALKKEFAENPNAMFVLWKDHTAVAEAEKINHLAKTWGGVDFTQFEGGIYSAEWFWAKILQVFGADKKVADAAVSFVEHCDWMTALLTGAQDLGAIKRSRCAMGHKAMWHRQFADAAQFAGGKVPDNAGGYPSVEFLSLLDPRLVPIQKSLGAQTFTSDQAAGYLSGEWGERLGIPTGIPVAVGAYDAHMGAVGGGVKAGSLVRVMGTSTCDVIVGPQARNAGGQLVSEPLVQGICGQVDGSVVPGMIGYEAGQSSFGDVYAWFKKILLWPVEKLLPGIEGIDEAQRNNITEGISKKIIPELENAAEHIDPRQSGLIALDWLNGRRSPDANQALTGVVSGISLGTDAVRFYKALVDATAFGARAIVERFREQGVVINEIIGIGGVARKSPLVMQTLADVLNMPINVPSSDQAVALGAAMFAATVAGIYPDIPAAQKALCSPVEKTYTPNAEKAQVYNSLYERYKKLGAFTETQLY